MREAPLLNPSPFSTLYHQHLGQVFRLIFLATFPYLSAIEIQSEREFENIEENGEARIEGHEIPGIPSHST